MKTVAKQGWFGSLTPEMGLYPMLKWKAAKLAAVSGVRNAKVLCWGHSGTAGIGANGTFSQSNNAAFSWVKQLADKFSNGNWQSWFGNPSQDPAVNGYDNRINSGSWLYYSDVNFSGLGTLYWYSSGVSQFTFLPTIPVDTFEIYYARIWAGANSMDVQIDSGGVTNYSTTSDGFGQILDKRVISTTLGSHTLKIARNTGEVWMNGITAYNSAAKGIIFSNAGASGLSAGGAVSNVTYAGHVGELTRLAPDLVIIQIEGNDILLATNPAAFSASVQTMITTAKNAGADVLLVIDIPLYNYQAGRNPYDLALKALAKSNKVNLLDMNTRWKKDYLYGFNKGWYFDDLHANKTGLADIAQAVYDYIT